MSDQVFGRKRPSLKQLLGSGIRAANLEEAISHGCRTEPAVEVGLLCGQEGLTGAGARVLVWMHAHLLCDLGKSASPFWTTFFLPGQ